MNNQINKQSLNQLSKEELIALLVNQEQVITNQGQVISNQEQVINKQEQVINNQESEIKHQERIINSQGSEIKHQERIINSQGSEIKHQEKTIIKQENKIKRLEAENRNLNIKVEELIAKYEDKMAVRKKALVEKFIPSSEKLKTEDLVINEIEVLQNKSKHKSPTETFIQDLKSLCNSEPIILDYDFETNGIDKAKVKDFGSDESYKLEINHIDYKVVRYERKKYKDKEKIYEAISDDPFPHSVLTPSLAANILVMKYDMGVPFYRYSNYLNSIGLNISDITMGNWASKAAELLNPLYDKIKESLLNTPYKVLHADETPLEVIDSQKSKCYMFVYATSYWDNAIYIYDFNESRSTDKTKETLKDYEGYLVCDGYVGYNSLTEQNIKLGRCWTHCRRNFNDVLKVLDEENKVLSPANKVLQLMSKIFKEESDYRSNKLTADQIYEKRNSKQYQQLLNKLDSYINGINTINNTLLNKAVEYYKKYKTDLYAYLDNGYMEMTNNLAERVVKPFVIARKNFLFCKTCDGADVTAKLFSIVQTAKANGLKVEPYLAYVMNNINKKSIEDLLPWSVNIPNEIKITQKDLVQ